MNVLLIDHSCDLLDLAMRTEAAGHKVRLWIKPDRGRTSTVGDGLVANKVSDWRLHVRWADLIVLSDNCHDMREIGLLTKQGYPVIGGTWESARLELDRVEGQLSFREAGIEILPATAFNNYREAMRHVERNPEGRWACKPSGEADKALSYCCHDAADMWAMLDRWRTRYQLKGPLILQQFCEGVEMGVSGWFGPGGWSKWWEENFEHKKLLAGDLGETTGEMGTVIRYTRESKLADQVLLPLTRTFQRLGYCGNVDVNCIVEPKGEARPLEYTIRLGHPAHAITSTLVEGDPVEWLADLTDGRDTLEVDTRIAVGVVLMVPPFPHSPDDRDDLEGLPLYGIEPGHTQERHGHICLKSVKLGSCPYLEEGKLVARDCYVSAGDYLAVAVGLGESVEQAQVNAYAQARRLRVANLGFRIDIGDRLEVELPKLKRLGYASGMRYAEPPAAKVA
jgi:phosphoribosylamine---glycine ligase